MTPPPHGRCRGPINWRRASRSARSRRRCRCCESWPIGCRAKPKLGKEHDMTLEEMDLHVPLTRQLGDGHLGPVVLINKFTVAPEDRAALISSWAEDAA